MVSDSNRKNEEGNVTGHSSLAQSPITGVNFNVKYDSNPEKEPSFKEEPNGPSHNNPKRPDGVFYSRSEHGSSVHLMLGGLEDNPSSEKLRELFASLSVQTGIKSEKLFHNTPVAKLYEDALKYEEGSVITSTGALATLSGNRTGRCPKDKRVVAESGSEEDVWWGPVNIPIEEHTFMINRERAVDYLKTRRRIYVFDGYAGWHPDYRIKVRVICARAYHALFMNNMLIRPTEEELETYGQPDFTILNAGEFPANKYTTGMTSETSVVLNFHTREMVILGTQYAGEMKKGIFTVMHYLMPKRGVLSLHSSANCGENKDDVSLFFGLSGTGKTTLSADVNRNLIGDDEHCWSDDGVFNIEGGCYAKCIDLSREKEPEIFDAIRFGSILENVVVDHISREVNFGDCSITENTRCAYPIEFIPNAKIPCIAGHPKNIIMLTCDAFGVLPPVSKLTTEQAMYHFISGYTAKVAGTEEGVREPTATFSACFGQPFLVWHPTKYAQMLADRIHHHKVDVWLVNTGWIGGKYGVGQRIPLRYSRSIIDAIHSGELADKSKTEYELSSIFNLAVPKTCTGVPSDILHPMRCWSDKGEYGRHLGQLAALFEENFKAYTGKATQEMRDGAPVL